MKCPKCGYVRVATDVGPDWQCPSCHVAYAKVGARSTEPVQPVSRSTPQPPVDDDQDELAALAASGQKIVIYSILFTFGFRGVVQANMVSPLAAAAIGFAVAAFSLFGTLRICSALQKSQNQKLVYMALCCLPWVNIIVLLVLNSRATSLLRSAGWRVGLLGARP